MNTPAASIHAVGWPDSRMGGVMPAFNELTRANPQAGIVIENRRLRKQVQQRRWREIASAERRRADAATEAVARAWHVSASGASRRPVDEEPR